MLTNRLTEAFKQASIRVSKEEEEAEESLLKSSWDEIVLNNFPNFDPNWPEDIKLKWFQAFDALLKKRVQVRNKSLTSSD